MASITPPGAGNLGPVDKSSGRGDSSRVERAGSGGGSTGRVERSTAGVDDDTVSVSTVARSVAELDASIERSPSLDSERIAELRSAIENGQYRIDAEKLAAAILRLEKDL